eukprot:TRINITY_DN56743_c0_g1_i1.p1 TRINITY_DN56743_c0_g1~~TRINITY_DN56743_c0_g1_i1.p1  ORF type:complete len:477 (+),score=95.21 TRINITY_DN56743_c0_g1_i1:88-1518(+)
MQCRRRAPAFFCWPRAYMAKSTSLLLVLGHFVGADSTVSSGDVPLKLAVPVAELEAARSRTALVTGAAGFVGSHVARHCRDLGMSVIAIDDLSGGFKSNIPAGVEFLQGDIKDPLFLERVFNERRIDFVYHLAAYAAEGLSHFIRSFNYRTNLVGSVELLNQALKGNVSSFVFTSSIAVYGSINDLSQMQNPNRSLSTSGHKPRTKVEVRGLTEEDQPTPEDPYGIAKLAFELDLKAAHELFGLNYVVFRPHNVYGPHQNMFDKYRNVVGIFINQIHHEKPITVFGDGEQVRAFSYIDDVAPAIARGPLVPSARNQVFNVGADKPYTVNELATAISKAMGSPGHPIVKEPARLEVEVAVSTHDKVKAHFPSPPAMSLEDGLARTVAWYRSQGKFFKPVEFSSVEVIGRMPPSWVRPDLRETSVCEGSRVGALSDESPVGGARGPCDTLGDGAASAGVGADDATCGLSGAPRQDTST